MLVLAEWALLRQTTYFNSKQDLSKIGRDLATSIIIDNLPENFKLQQNNGFEIRTWNEDVKDTQLGDLTKILKGSSIKFNIIQICMFIK